MNLQMWNLVKRAGEPVWSDLMRCVFGAVCAILLCACVGCAGKQFESATAKESKWRSLFDGETLEGWVQRGGRAVYTAKDGQIIGTTRPDQPNSFLCTQEDFADFELVLEFKVDPRLNSGVQIRSQSLPDYQDGRVHGYQVEIDPSERAWTGGIYDESRRGWLAPLEGNEAARAAFAQDEWNRMRVLAVGNRIQTWINDVPTADLTDDATSSGFIGLQVHGVGDRATPLEVRWQRLRIREIGG